MNGRERWSWLQSCTDLVPADRQTNSSRKSPAVPSSASSLPSKHKVGSCYKQLSRNLPQHLPIFFSNSSDRKQDTCTSACTHRGLAFVSLDYCHNGYSQRFSQGTFLKCCSKIFNMPDGLPGLRQCRITEGINRHQTS